MPSQKEEQFWVLVMECLRTLLGYERRTATKETLAYRDLIESWCKKLKTTNIIYHESPIQVACYIAGLELTTKLDEAFDELLAAKAKSKNVVNLPKSKTEKSASRVEESAASGMYGRQTAKAKTPPKKATSKKGSGDKGAAAAKRSAKNTRAAGSKAVGTKSKSSKPPLRTRK